MKLLKKHDWLILLVFCLTGAAALNYSAYPGGWTPDTIGVYTEILTGDFHNHHPPLLALWWKCLMLLIPSPGSLLLFNQLLLWASIFVFAITLRKHYVQYRPMIWVFLIIPLMPPVLYYSTMLWKDIGFAYSFLLTAALCTKATLDKRKFNILTVVLIALLMFYALGIKYQAIYVLPLVCVWFVWIQSGFQLKIQSYLYALLIALSLSYCERTFENICGVKNIEFWQVARIYDLAGISVAVDKPLMPGYILRNPKFSMEALKKNYTPIWVDDLTWNSGTLIMTDSPEDLQELRSMFWKNVFKYPKAFLNHRRKLFKNLILKEPRLNQYAQVDANPYDISVADNWLHTAINRYTRELPALLYKLAFWLPFSIVYLVFGAFAFLKYKIRIAVPLFFMNAMTLWLCCILFFLTMASDYRYIYFCLVMIFFCHPIAFLCLQDYLKTKNSECCEKN